MAPKNLRLKPPDFLIPAGLFFQMALASEPKRSELYKKHTPNETDALAKQTMPDALAPWNFK
jgi:hypothetical protein